MYNVSYYTDINEKRHLSRKNNIVFIHFIQRFLSENELKMILEEFNHVETTRKCTLFSLLSYLVHTASNEWKILRHTAAVSASIGLISIDHSSLSKHMKVLDYAIMKRIFHIIMNELNRAARRKKQLFSRGHCNSNSWKNMFTLGTIPRSNKLHISYTNATEMPLKAIETTGLKHDGPIGIKLEVPRFTVKNH